MRKQRRFNAGECGQAALEFAVMLIGFGMLLLGMIFLCAVSFDDNGILLDAKYRAESAAGTASEGVSGVSGDEIQTWTYSKLHYVSIMKDKTVEGDVIIPFTAADSRLNADPDVNSIGKVGSDFADDSVSVPTPRSGGGKTFSYGYKWLSPGGFASDLTSDYNDELNSGENGLGAAGLILGNSSGNTSKTMENIFRNAKGNGADYSYGQVYDWFGLRVRAADLSKSPSNQVYMPRNR